MNMSYWEYTQLQFRIDSNHLFIILKNFEINYWHYLHLNQWINIL